MALPTECTKCRGELQFEKFACLSLYRTDKLGKYYNTYCPRCKHYSQVRATPPRPPRNRKMKPTKHV